MLNNQVLKLLQQKINNEYFRANNFLDISGWAGDLALKGVQGYFQHLSKNSLARVNSLIEYVNESGAQIDLGSIAEGQREFTDIEALFVYLSELETQQRNELNTLLDVCLAEKDFATFAAFEGEAKNLHAQEFFLKSTLEKIALLGKQGQGLYLLDKELEGKYPLEELVVA